MAEIGMTLDEGRAWQNRTPGLVVSVRFECFADDGLYGEPFAYFQSAIDGVMCSGNQLTALASDLNRNIINARAVEEFDAEFVYFAGEETCESLALRRQGGATVVDGVTICPEFCDAYLAIPVVRVLHNESPNLERAIVDAFQSDSGHIAAAIELIEQSRADMVRRLVEQGIDPTPLLFVVVRNGNADLLRDLLHAGADPARERRGNYNLAEWQLTLLPFDGNDRTRDNDAFIIRQLAVAGCSVDEHEFLHKVAMERAQVQAERQCSPREATFWAHCRDEAIVRQILAEASRPG